MTTPRAYETVEITLGDLTVAMRPTLRAASLLEANPGLETLFKNLSDGHLGTMLRIIRATAETNAATALIKVINSLPLGAVMHALQAPLADLCAGFMPETRKAPETATQPNDKALTWGDAYAQLHARAVGWLHLPSQDAWNSTPTEIARALEEHLELMKAIHGASEEDSQDQTGNTEAQRAQNEAEGLDPEFDRVGLRALKARMQGNE